MATVNLTGSVELSSASQRNANNANDTALSGRSVERQAASKDTAPIQQVQATQKGAELSAKEGMLLSREDIEKIAQVLQKYNNKLKFKVSEYSNLNWVVEVRTADDGALVRQIPQEELLTLNERLSELSGFDV